MQRIPPRTDTGYSDGSKADFLGGSAKQLSDLRAPPGNRLEALFGNREGQHSISIIQQYRICFEWRDEGPANVEIVDYH